MKWLKFWKWIYNTTEKIKPSNDLENMDTNIEKPQEINIIDIGKIPTQKPQIIETSTSHINIINTLNDSMTLNEKQTLNMEANKIKAKVIAANNSTDLEESLNDFLNGLDSNAEIISTNFTGNKNYGLYVTILYLSKYERV